MNEKSFGYPGQETIDNQQELEKKISRRDFLTKLTKIALGMGLAALVGDNLKSHGTCQEKKSIVEKKENVEEKCERMRQASVDISKIAVLRSHTFSGIKNASENIDTHYGKTIYNAAKKYNIDANMLKALILLESNGNKDRKNDDGAVGLCQFLANTAKSYGLRVDNVVDERYNPEKSIYAACRFLDSHNKLYGNQNLAFETYHIGAGNMADLISLYCGHNKVIPDTKLAENVQKHKLTYQKMFFTCTSKDKVVNDYTYIEHGKAYKEDTNVYKIFNERLLYDNAPIYLWRIQAIMRILRELKEKPQDLQKEAEKYSREKCKVDDLLAEQRSVLKQKGFNDEQIAKLRMDQQFKE